MDSHRFGLEVRSVLVSWRAGVRSLDHDSVEARAELQGRALDLLEDVTRHYPGADDDPSCRELLRQARDEIRSGQPPG